MKHEDMINTLRDMGKSVYGTALTEYINTKIDNMNDVTTCNSWEETKARGLAVKTLRDILSIISKDAIVKKEKTRYN